MKKTFLIFFAFFGLTALAQQQPTNRCGWIIQNPGNSSITDANGVFIISTPTERMFYDGSHDLIRVPEVHIRWGEERDEKKVFCGCVVMTSFNQPNMVAPLANIESYEPKSLESCFNDPKLPNLNRVLR